MIIPVFILFFVFVCLAFFEKKSHSLNRISLFLIWMFLLLIATFRPDEMADYANYLYVFLTGDSERMEVGFMWIVDALRSISAPIWLFFAFFAAISILIRLWCICKMSAYIFSSLLIYVSNIYILHDLIQVRCAIASSLLLLALKYVQNREIYPFLTVSGIALLFHYSAVIILPLWFLNTTKLNKLLFLSFIPIAYIFAFKGFLFGSFVRFIPVEGIQTLWDIYEKDMLLGDGDEINIFNYLHLARCLICSFLILNAGVISKHYTLFVLLVKIYTISLVSFVAFSDIPVIAFRISELYQVVEILLIPSLLFVFKNVIVGKLLVFVIGFAFLLINTFFIGLLP